MHTITATAPGRCGLVGNPSDMYGGSVLSCTTSERATCRVSPSEQLRLANTGEHAHIATRDELALRGDHLDIARAALTFFDIDPASACFTLDLSTAIPMRAGLAGSTALLAAVAGALNVYLEWALGPYDLAEAIRKIEARVMQVVCGFQDQHMAVFGGLNFMTFEGKESLQQREEEPLGVVEPLAPLVQMPPLLLANTGVQHHSGTVHTSPRERWLAGDTQVIEGYARIAKMAAEAKRALLSNDLPRLGRLMSENHAVVANLGGSGKANELLIAAAMEAGALGAKLAGAGGGGTILVLGGDLERIGAALRQAGAHNLYTPRPMPGLTVRSE